MFIAEKHKSDLRDNYRIFLANSESPIFQDVVQEKLWEFLSGQFLRCYL